MKVEQISIFIENKSGRLAEVTRVLGEAGVNIRALSLADTSDFGILRLIVDQTDKAKETLKSEGFTVNKTEVVAVEVYAFVERCGENAVIIFRFDDIEGAIKVLLANNITVLKGERVCQM